MHYREIFRTFQLVVPPEEFLLEDKHIIKINDIILNLGGRMTNDAAGIMVQIPGNVCVATLFDNVMNYITSIKDI